VEIVQVALICLVGLGLGWHPHGDPLGVVLLLALGTAAFSGLGLLLGGTLRGLTTLAAANLLWFVLLALGGVLYPLSQLGPGEAVCRWLPTAALSDGLRQLLQHSTLSGQDLLALVLWAVVGLAAASRLFRWE
jgi:ABC-2 type transport system permease protein